MIIAHIPTNISYGSSPVDEFNRVMIFKGISVGGLSAIVWDYESSIYGRDKDFWKTKESTKALVTEYTLDNLKFGVMLDLDKRYMEQHPGDIKNIEQFRYDSYIIFRKHVKDWIDGQKKFTQKRSEYMLKFSKFLYDKFSIMNFSFAEHLVPGIDEEYHHLISDAKMSELEQESE